MTAEDLPSDSTPDRTLNETAYRRVRSDIIAGVRRPGERLKIEHLRELYGVGPSPLREALQRLAGDGLVSSEGRRGFAVAPLTSEELRDLTEIRKVLEAHAIRLSIENGGEAWEAAIVAAAYRLEKADRRLQSGDTGEMSDWEARNREFHNAVAAACNSPWLMKLRNIVYDQHERYRRASVGSRSRTRDLAAEHAAIRDAVLARNAELAGHLTADHIERTAQDFLAVPVPPAKSSSTPAAKRARGVPPADGRKKQPRAARSRELAR